MQVLVVGGGPVGLTLAAELARHGIRPRVIDTLPAPSGYCKAIGVTPRTLEVWENMGIVRPMMDAGLWLRGTRMTVAGKATDTAVDLPDLPYGSLAIPQFATERILAEHLGQFGIPVERGVSFTALHDDGARIAVELAHADGRTQQAEFDYVVGCDGAHSAVRRALQIDFPGDRFPLAFMLGDVTIDWDLPRGFTNFVVVPRENGAPDFLVAIPLPDQNRYRVTMLASPEFAASADARNPQERGLDHGIASERPGPSLVQLQEVADRLLPGKPRLGNLRWSSLFGISMRLADRYRVGRAFLAGDAAHIHPPTGGQGMNTGIQDAYNLAWKLALVLYGDAGGSLLDSYEAERRPVGADVVARTRAASMSLGRERLTREHRLADTQILVNYRESAWVTGIPSTETASVRAGDRAPDVVGLRREKVGFPLRLFDVLQGTAHVVIIALTAQSEAQAPRVQELAAQVAHEHAGPVRVVAIVNGGSGGPDIPAVTVLHDPAGAFTTAYGASAESVFLVRPDGYLAYVASTLDLAPLQAAIARSLGRDAAPTRAAP